MHVIQLHPYFHKKEIKKLKMTYCSDFSTVGYTFQFLTGQENKGQSSEHKQKKKTLLTGLYLSFILTPLLVTGHMNTQRQRRLRPESVNDREESCPVIYLTSPDNFPADFQRTLSINSACVSMGEIKHQQLPTKTPSAPLHTSSTPPPAHCRPSCMAQITGLTLTGTGPKRKHQCHTSSVNIQRKKSV